MASCVSFNKINVGSLLSQKFDKDWLIGRVVGKKTALGFLPTESRLREVVAERNATQLGEMGRSVDEPLVSLLTLPLLLLLYVTLLSSRTLTLQCTKGLPS